ncbi:MAG: alpha/beta fold hydrolase [Patescibacteria group bacterium]
MEININYIWTEDNLRLQGIHYVGKDNDICVLFIHGMSGNFIENYFAHVLGEKLSKQGVGFIYGHNRGYNHINDIYKRKIGKEITYTTERHGATYERFNDCIYDINAWVNEVFRLGYKKIVLVGHSLGCNKVVHYIYKKSLRNLIGVILLSPPDMVANGKESGKSKVYDKQLSEAKRNIENGHPRKLLSGTLWDWYTISSQTFLDMFEDGCPADNLPIMRNPKSFPELESIKVPVFTIMGEFDDIVVRTLDDDISILEKRATKAPSFDKEIIPKANHT